MGAEFWNDRYRTGTYVYGTTPNRFVQQQTDRWAEGQSVLVLGAGEGRNAVFLAEQELNVTALDYASEGLRKLQALAEERELLVETVQADVTTWTPTQQWDGVVCTFLHLPAPARPGLYCTMQKVLRPGGVLVAEWFRPEQITEGYESGGPPAVDMMVTADELRSHFDKAGVCVLHAVETMLDEGTHHHGPAAVVRFVWQRPAP